jgi:pimeloyl-ACP methyl ester carboxylesterase
MTTWRAVRRVVALLAACLVLPAGASAQRDLGVILIYGKKGTPSQGLNVIQSNLQSAGVKAVMPAMPWGGGRWDHIDATVEDVLVMIDAQAAQLRSQGASRIVLIGQSLGSAVSMGYAAQRGTLAGLVVTAPGHATAHRNGNGSKAADVARARALVDQGKGNEIMIGGDANQGQTLRMSVRAAVYYSWFSADGLASLQAQAQRLPASTPLLLVIGQRDSTKPQAEREIYQPAAKNPYSKYLVNGGNHDETPLASAKAIVDWVLALPR